MDTSIATSNHICLIIYTNILKTQIEQIEKLTCNQNLSKEWKNQRKGRITASNFHRVVSNVNMMDHGKPVSKSLLAEILGGKDHHNCIPSIKWGHEKEAVGKINYLPQLRKDGHRNVIAQDIGLLLDSDEPFLGATPDLLLQCDCCGVGALEVKCPWSIRFSDPKVVRPSYVDNGGLLKESCILHADSRSYGHKW
ncbi:hypothetical protein ACJMK2_012438 [Sinanodonta woodiana]|uniref:YqaJ viral recombinase domain-containing protein n=1 Tax=Sinanodonta woodiana TaxID=1069815 RepID=A0ABD3VB48_SINWO